MTDINEEVERISKKLDAIENNIHQTKNQSRQDPLNYGIRVNNRLAFLMADQQRGDFPPTDQAIQVRTEMSAELEGYLSTLEKVFSEDIQNLNGMVRERGLPLVTEPQEAEIVN